MGERGIFRKCEGSISRIWGENECRSETIIKVGYGREKRLW